MSPSPGRHQFTSTEGDLFEVRVPSPADIASFFVFSCPRCGSTLLDRMLRELCDAASIPYLNIADDAFAAGVPTRHIGQSVEALFVPRGFGYLGFRNFVLFDPVFDFSTVSKVLLVRDPRDMVVSLYFALKHSHAIPSRGAGSVAMRERRGKAQLMDIDEWLVERGWRDVRSYQKSINRYRRFIFDDRLKLYRYEQVIFEKATWLRELADYLSIPASDDRVAEIARRHDIFPEQEDAHAHIRQVKPGNHRRHLSEASIAYLNEMLAEELEFLGY